MYSSNLQDSALAKKEKRTSSKMTHTSSCPLKIK